MVDAALGTGATLGRSGDETASRRTPVFLDVDVGLVFDRDFGFEFGVGLWTQIEQQPAFAVTPQFRLVRDLGSVDAYVGAGIPFFFTPFTRLGFELGSGILFPLTERFSLVAAGQIDVFFLGGDIPEDTTVIMFNLAFGGRVRF